MSSERDPLLQNRGINDDDYQDDPNKRIGKLTLLEKILTGTSSLFFIVLCILSALYARRVYNEPTAPEPPSVCLTPECVLTAAQVLQDIDTSINPCDDFYQYTCNQWERNHEIAEGKSAIGSFLILRDQNKEALRTILSGTFEEFGERVPVHELSDKERKEDKENFEKAKSLYDSCMNEALIDRRGGEPIEPLLKHLQHLVSTGKLTEGLSYLAQRGVGGLFDVNVDADFTDPTVNVLMLSQAGLSLPTKDYYLQKETTEALKDAIADTLTGLSYKEAKNTAKAIVEFETKLAKISDPPEYFQDPEGINNPMLLSALSKISPKIKWGSYVSKLLPENVPHPSKIVVTSPHYIGNVSTLLEEEEDSVIEAFLIWKAIYAYAGALGEDIRGPIRRLNAKLIGADPKSIRSRWDTCLDEANDSIGFLIGRYYVLEKFGGDAKGYADQFVKSIKDVFVKRLPELSWLDSVTRERAEEKVDKLIRKIGYPDSLPDVMSPPSLSEYYRDLKLERDDYFGNYLNTRQWSIQEEWKKIGKAPEKKIWLMNPQEVNAYYNPSFNEIVFPAGILQNPFFGTNYPDYLNYGGIGVVVGHELTHGFDNNGRHFDADGKLTQWWTEETSAKFDEKASCFVKQYSNFSMTDENGKEINVNGKLTLGENLADNGGLREAYLAWKEQYDGDRENEKYNNVLLPGLDDLTPEQLFFISFGRIWCNKATPAQAKKSVLTDEHSPPKWRVNGAVQNSQDFSKVFNCPVGSPMNPVHKCELW